MQNTVKGLITQKADTPAPVAGQTRPYVWSEIVGRSGKAYTKIKFDTQQGQPCKIISAQKTDYADQYGNISYSIEIEPGSLPAASSQQNGTLSDSWRQHLMRAANLLAKCHEAAKAVGLEEGEDARSLFIDASRAGYIAQMPAKPFGSDPEPTPESDEPRPEDLVHDEF
jgi:hypothetical protein